MVVVIWIDWYAYHIARLRALVEHAPLHGKVAGVEMVGGTGVHRGLNFRDESRGALPITTLLPGAGWREAGQRQLAAAVWRKLDELDPSVVLVPGYYNAPALAAALWGKLRGRRTVLMTESTQHDHARSAWKEAAKGRLIRGLFDWAVAGGEAHVRYLRALGFPASRIARCYDVVDNKYFADGVAHLRDTSEPAKHELPPRYFVYVGRLAEEKNVDGLLRAFAAYRERGGDRSLVLVGAGPEEAALRAQAEAARLTDAVVFAGLKPAAELLPYYAFADWFVLPSTREPWGLVVNEAMAAGLPVLVSNRCGCVEDLVEDSRNGFTFDPDNDAALADGLLRLGALRNRELAAMGQRSREIVANFAPERWAAEVARVVGAAA